MFNLNNKDDNPNLNSIIDQLTVHMSTLPLDDPDYVRCLSALERLHEINDKKSKARGLDPNAVLAASTNVLGILIIVAYEHKHIVTSKALGFIQKVKLG